MTKKNILVVALLSAAALGGVAVAAETIVGPRGPMRADTNGDGIVSRSEFFTAAETRFKARDANGDRKLAGDEMKDRRGRFARMDTNNDGSLGFDEAAARTSAQFTGLDVDRDGKLTPEELGPRGKRGHVAGMMRPGAQRGPMGGRGMGAMLLQRLDTDKDGKISRAEMRVQADQRFDRLDVNKDGFIDSAEMPMRGGRGGPGGDMPPPPPEDGGE